jgi:UDP-N-acetyl-D-glucosamine dehydrogenase
MKNELVDKIKSKNANVCVVGLGYVGLPLALSFSEAGFPVLGLDIDVKKISYISSGKTYIAHIKDERIAEATRRKNFVASTDFSKANAADAIIICVPTPLNKYREPDLSFIINTFEALLTHLKKGQVLSLESTTYPGTTEEELKPRLEQKGFVIGENYFLIFSPEREDPGNPKFNTKNIPKICGGITKNCLEIGIALYGSVVEKVVPVSSTATAEMAKLLENIHRAVNIGLVNEMKIICDRMGIDIYEVVRAAATKPFGFVPYYPGPGLGGHCIPIDPFYLTWRARYFGLHTRFIELAGEINSSMPEWVVNKIIDALNCRKKSVAGSNILVLGIAYKKNVDDMRESPAVEIMDMLEKKGATLAYSDPFIPHFPKIRKRTFDLASIPLTAENLSKFDVAAIITNHDAFDYKLIYQHSQLIVDTRGVYTFNDPKIVKG